MNMELTIDFADKAYEDYGRFMLDVAISPKRLKVDDYVVTSWRSPFC